jgi:SpoU rRNA methylase family enzyme
MTQPTIDQRLRQRERESRWDRTLYAVESVLGAVAALAIAMTMLLGAVYVMTAGGV